MAIEGASIDAPIGTPLACVLTSAPVASVDMMPDVAIVLENNACIVM